MLRSIVPQNNGTLGRQRVQVMLAVVSPLIVALAAAKPPRSGAIFSAMLSSMRPDPG
jgi:hypothetical protein